MSFFGVLGLPSYHWAAGYSFLVFWYGPYDLDQFLKKMRPQVTHMMAFENMINRCQNGGW